MTYRWWEEHRDRWAEELRRLQSSDFFRLGQWSPSDQRGQIVVKGTLRIQDAFEEEIEVLLGTDYPYCSPTVLCGDPRLKESLHYDPATHQICVHFEDLDPWQPDVHYAANYLERVRDWFLAEKQGFRNRGIIDVPEPFDFRRLPANWLVDWVDALVIPEDFFRLPLRFAGGRLSAYWNKQARLILLTELKDESSGETVSMDSDAADFSFAGVGDAPQHGKEIRGYWFTATGIPPRDRREIWAYVVDELRRTGIRFGAIAFDSGEKLHGGWGLLLGIRYVYGGERHWIFPFLLFSSRSSAKRGEAPAGALFVPAYGIRVHRDLFLRLEGVVDYAVLAQRRVVVVGAGTLGGYSSLLLAQAGVGNFALYDGDRLEPGNVVRHVCDLRVVGKYKVHGLKAAIMHRNPAARVAAHPVTFEQDLGQFLAAASKADLILNAIGSQNTARLLNRLLVKHAHKPAVHGWLTLGAVAGEVLRVVPNRTACVECLSRHASDIGHAIQLPSVDIERTSRLFPAGCAFPALPGAMVDISFVASLMARLGIQTLLEGSGSTTYPNLDGDYLFWTNRLIPGSTLEPLTCYRRSYTPSENCEVCGRRDQG
jgi:molybdopterin/thiamine biosynthesis adenylyltransferase